MGLSSPVSSSIRYRHLYLVVPQMRTPQPFLPPCRKQPLQITPFDMNRVPIPLNTPSFTSPSYRSTPPFAQSMRHSPHCDPQQKSPSQTVPSQYVYLPFPCICPSLNGPTYLSPFLKVTVLSPSGCPCLNSPSTANSPPRQAPFPWGLPLWKCPWQTSPLGWEYLPSPCRFPPSNLPSRTVSPSLSREQHPVSAFLSSDGSILKVERTLPLSVREVTVPARKLPLLKLPLQRVLCLSTRLPFPLSCPSFSSPSYTQSPLLSFPSAGRPWAKEPSKVAPPLKASRPLPCGLLSESGPVQTWLAQLTTACSAPIEINNVFHHKPQQLQKNTSSFLAQPHEP